MKKSMELIRTGVFLAVLALTALGIFGKPAEAGVWVYCYNPGGDACIIYWDDGTVEYYANWVMGNDA